MIVCILLLIVLIFINGVLSSGELAFLSLEKFELERLVRQRKKNAKKIRKMLDNPNKLMSTTQVGITLLGFLSSAFASSYFTNLIINKGFYIISDSFTYGILIVLITVILSFITLVLGELVPKKIALYKPYEVAAFSAGFIRFLQIIFYPLIKLLSISTKFICNMLGIKEREKDFSKDDIKRIIITGTKDGIIQKKEQEYIFNIFKFNDTTVDKVMTKKEDCIFINLNSNEKQVLKNIKDSKFTRYPVYDGDINNIIGIFNVKDFIMYKKDNNDFNLEKLLYPVKKIDYKEKIDDVFASMQKEHIQMALVYKKDEFIGIVTLEDAVEEILGHLYNEYDEE